MALVSGGRSTLNPNAPLYIPAAVRQVEDFSPEWYELITTSTWFRDYWLSQHHEADMFYNHEEDVLDSSDIVDLLPDEIDLGIEEDLSYMESQFQELALSHGYQEDKNTLPKGSKFAAKSAEVPGKGH